MIYPIQDKVFIRAEKSEESTESGIALPSIAAKEQDHGVVVAVGPGKSLESGGTRMMRIQEGNVVAFPRIKCQSIKINGEDLLVISEGDVFAIIGMP